MINIQEIFRLLPHRYPFLLVDRILEVDGEHVIGLKNITINEPFFVGHFPDEPVMPGVLLLEAMGQVAAMLVVNLPEASGMVSYLTGVNNARFRRPVKPGDQLITEARLIKFRSRVGKVQVTGRVDGEVAAEAELSFVLAQGLSREDSKES
ncbi:MAG TPA: 3-hydroxyacyl-ACP dehydratase FabZ [Synergistaceae bacterium]|nr:3-hydroxyacyl-ACP dehydratase FabZ [Synergistaceae bacterium]HQF90591.1 3-hydroxyacyl-ACP dehydratase FabZ [Synergistaceae bacterium]HQH77675.1 3-hydroxyacyl-ACP dehydratase FabZ [Synergistaceae bacterium]HQK24169.1 3-hydroxyacyl-ACP dehydratase FabZ [Synergistaceae bacterium]